MLALLFTIIKTIMFENSSLSLLLVLYFVVVIKSIRDSVWKEEQFKSLYYRGSKFVSRRKPHYKL